MDWECNDTVRTFEDILQEVYIHPVSITLKDGTWRWILPPMKYSDAWLRQNMHESIVKNAKIWEQLADL